jgi:hypothetical protein
LWAKPVPSSRFGGRLWPNPMGIFDFDLNFARLLFSVK